MWDSQKQRHLRNHPPKQGDFYLVCADGAFMAYKSTARAATRLMNKLAKSGRFAVVEWEAI